MGQVKIAVVGGGSAGLFSAWYLARMAPEAEIHLFESKFLGSGATRAAAGMLAPINELEFQELPVLHAGRASLDLYLNEIEPSLGGDIGLIKQGTLEVPLSLDDVGYLQRLYEFQKSQGLPVQWLNAQEIKEKEPLISPEIQHAIWSEQDIQIDQWHLLDVMEADLKAKGIHFHLPCKVESWKMEGSDVALQTEEGTLRFDKVLVAVGAMDPVTLKMLPYNVYPVRGELLGLLCTPELLPQTTIRIRSLTYGNAYIVPKYDRVIVGSTSEERGHKLGNTAGAMLDILRKCHTVLPGLYEMEFADAGSGLRPSTLERTPMLDRESGTEIYHLNGLFRHGILLGPIMGKAAATLMLTDHRIPEVEHFHFPEF